MIYESNVITTEMEMEKLHVSFKLPNFYTYIYNCFEIEPNFFSVSEY